MKRKLLRGLTYNQFWISSSYPYLEGFDIGSWKLIKRLSFNEYVSHDEGY